MTTKFTWPRRVIEKMARRKVDFESARQMLNDPALTIPGNCGERQVHIGPGIQDDRPYPLFIAVSADVVKTVMPWREYKYLLDVTCVSTAG